jgi:hypothetical protein
MKKERKEHTNTIQITTGHLKNPAGKHIALFQYYDKIIISIGRS